MSDEKLTEGWGFPGGALKAHFFRGAKSLCARWLYTGPLEADNGPSRDDCAACRRLVDAEKVET